MHCFDKFNIEGVLMSSQNRCDGEDRQEMEERQVEQNRVDASKERIIKIMNVRYVHDMQRLLAQHADVQEARDVYLKDFSLEDMEIAFTQ